MVIKKYTIEDHNINNLFSIHKRRMIYMEERFVELEKSKLNLMRLSMECSPGKLSKEFMKARQEHYALAKNYIQMKNNLSHINFSSMEKRVASRSESYSFRSDRVGRKDLVEDLANIEHKSVECCLIM